MAFINEKINDFTPEIMDIKSLIESRNYKISQGLFDRERKCFLIKIFDGSVKEWSTDSISFWLMSLDKV